MRHLTIILALVLLAGCKEKPPERVLFHVCCNNSEHEDPTQGYRCRAANYVRISSRADGMQIQTEDVERAVLETFVLPHESFCVVAEGLDQYQKEIVPDRASPPTDDYEIGSPTIPGPGEKIDPTK